MSSPTLAVPVNIDLIPTSEVSRKIFLGSVMCSLGIILMSLLVTVVAGAQFGLVFALVMSAAAALACVYALRRRLQIERNVIFKRGVRTSRMNVTAAESATLVVRSGSVSTVTLRVAGRNARGRFQVIDVPLAVYAGIRGRELSIVGTRKLADALKLNDAAAFNAVGDVLVTQLRAQAQDRPLADRPLFVASKLGTSVLTQQQVSALLTL